MPERIEPCGPVRPPPLALQRAQEPEREDLLPEVPPVERAAEDRFVHRLELAHRERAGEKRVDEVRVRELRAKPPECGRDDGVVIVRERRKRVDGPPADACVARVVGAVVFASMASRLAEGDLRDTFAKGAERLSEAALGG